MKIFILLQLCHLQCLKNPFGYSLNHFSESNLESTAHDKRREPHSRDQQNHYLNEEKFLLLQSIVMAVQIRDIQALAQLEDHLIPHIAAAPQQRDLLRLLVKSMMQRSN